MDLPSDPSAFVRLKTVYRDLPDMIEVEVEVCSEGWRGLTFAYVSPQRLLADAERLRIWTHGLKGSCIIGFEQVLEDFGSFCLCFHEIDTWRHLACRVDLGGSCGVGRADTCGRRITLDLRTELCLIDRFLVDLRALAESQSDEATLQGLMGP